LDWTAADALANRHGDSFFVLDDLLFRANFENFLAAFRPHYPDVRIGYSYKTNYTPHLCRIVDELGGYAEVVSDMEYELARRIGVVPSRIIFNGPYKAAAAFKDAALGGATINLDSPRDFGLLAEIAASNTTARFGAVIRCNFSLDPERISRFGYDVEGRDFAATVAAISEIPNLYLKGFHCHFPDRDLASFGRRCQKMAALVREIFPDSCPEVLNIGGGYASNMPAAFRKKLAFTPATFAEYGKLVGGTMSAALAGYDRLPTLFLEPGTALVADTLRFYTRVISIKTIRGRNFATTAGSLFDISPSARLSNLPVTPLYRENRAAAGKEVFDVVGYTCIESDVLSRQLPATLAVGDILCFENVGSYSIVMKPPFILPANPVLIRKRGDFEVIRQRETADHIFRNFRF
jgi:diaminopimelate decarboxylase